MRGVRKGPRRRNWESGWCRLVTDGFRTWSRLKESRDRLID